MTASSGDEAALDPIRSPKAVRRPSCPRQRRAHRARHLQQQPHAVLERAAIGSVALVGQAARGIRGSGSRAHRESRRSRIRPARPACAASTKVSTSSRDSGFVERASGRASRRRRESPKARPSATGPRRRASGPPPCPGRRIEALRPAWASWMPKRVPGRHAARRGERGARPPRCRRNRARGSRA